MVAERITFHIEANRIYGVHIGAHCMRSASTNQNVVRDAYTNIRDHFDWYWQEYVATGIVVGAIAIGLYGFVTAMNRWDAQIKLENRIEIETYFFFVQFLPALTASSNTALRPSPVLAEHSINMKKKTKRKYYKI